MVKSGYGKESFLNLRLPVVIYTLAGGEGAERKRAECSGRAGREEACLCAGVELGAVKEERVQVVGLPELLRGGGGAGERQ